MKTLFIPSEGDSRRLIILFLGWGFRSENFGYLRKPGYDILIVSDYRNFDIEALEELIKQSGKDRDAGNAFPKGADYREYVVIGWSFGVRAASEFIRKCHLKNVSLRLAVNGTMQHIDDSQGIPRRIFQGTLQSLSPANLTKFRLRCAGDKETFLKFDSPISANDFEDLKEELEYFGNLSPSGESATCWDKAIVGGKDRIFPPENQRRAWMSVDLFEEPEMNHLPDFQYILDRYIVDKSKVSTTFDTAAESYGPNAIVQHDVAVSLLEFLKPYLPESEETMELGYGDGTLTRLYLPYLHGHLSLYDIKESSLTIKQLEQQAEKRKIQLHFHWADVETVRFDRRFNLIISSSMLQWLNSPAAVVERCTRALLPGGILGLAFYGPGTFEEISAITGNGLKYPSLLPLCHVAERMGMEIITAREERRVLTFSTPAEALRHLKLTGVNALPSSTSPGQIRRLLARWTRNETGHATLTFECKYLIAKLS